MVAQAFLAQECRNLRALLDRTLRYEYGAPGSKLFYEECLTRLLLLEQEVKAATHSVALAISSYHLNELAKLICRLERSSLGEYSWPFVDELKRIADVICTEDTEMGDNVPNPIWVLADGGLDSYCIFAENRRVNFTQRRLLTIVFPKSLKQFVLLHSILGHELGHAIYRCSKHQKELKDRVESHIKQGHFANPEATAAHLFSADAPDLVQGWISMRKVGQQNLFTAYADWSAWCEELLCDLIGMIIFGPSFIAAECEMLWSLGCSGAAFDPGHPVAHWRLNCLLAGAKILKFSAPPPEGHPLHGYHENFWKELEKFRGPNAWCDALIEPQIQKALEELQDILGKHPPTAYVGGDPDTLIHLIRQLESNVPPVGYSLSPEGEPKFTDVDFRQILLAGWYVKSNPPLPTDENLDHSTRVLTINQLCEHAIMQQRAIGLAAAA